jgi:carbamoyl-phosphate synthase large subunit
VQIEDLIKDRRAKVKTLALSAIDRDQMFKLKRKGFSDIRLAKLLGVTEKTLRSHRHKLKVLPVYKRVDTCAAEFATDTAYMYSTYEEECEAAIRRQPRQDHDSRWRPQPYRPGYRVRLLLRARGAGAA